MLPFSSRWFLCIFFIFLSEIRNHNFLYVAMVTGLALSSRGEELVFCSHRGLNSCWTRWPADMEQQLPSQRLVPALSYICLGWLVFVPEFFAARQSHQMWVFTSGRRPHSSRCGERVLMLPPRGGSRGGMMVWTVLHQKRAVLCCSDKVTWHMDQTFHQSSISQCRSPFFINGAFFSKTVHLHNMGALPSIQTAVSRNRRKTVQAQSETVLAS